MSIYFIILPFIAALAVFFLPNKSARTTASLASLATLALTILALRGFNSDGSFNYLFEKDWIPSAGISLRLGMDGIAMLLVILTNLAVPLIVNSSFGREMENESRYYGLILLMQAALNGVFLALDGFAFYVFWELALIPIYFICAIWGGDNRVRVTLKFFIYTFVGSLFMLLALLYVYLQTPGTHSFAWEDLVNVQLSTEAAKWVFLGLFLAFAIKMPIFPFHTWQPDTYVTAPTGGTMLLSGIMLKMGLYGLIRWMMPIAPEAIAQWTPYMIVLAVIGIVYASIIAIKQSDMKRLIAYSSIAHVGLIAAGILAWNKTGLQGGMIQMLNHGINVIGLFFIVEMIERRLNTRTLSEMGGIAKVAPKFAILFMIIMLGAVAVPLTNGFVGEFLLLNSVWSYNPWLGAVAGLTIIFGAVYMLRVYQLAMFGPTNDETERFVDVDLREMVVLGLIAAFVLIVGFFPQGILDLTAASVERTLGLVQF